MNRRRFFSALALLVAVLAAGCGSGGMRQEAPGRGQADYASPSQPAERPPAAAPSPQSPSDQKVMDPSSANVPQSERKIILNAEVHVKVEDVEKAIGELRDLAAASGGYVAGSQVTGQKHTGRQGTISMRIPSGNYEPFVQRIQEFGEVQDFRDGTQDVTAEFLDLEPRIAAKEKHLEQLMALYNRSGSIEELMRLTTEIDRVQGELDSMKGRLKYLTNQVDFSTITVRLFEESSPLPPPPPRNVWERAVRSFKNSVIGLVTFMGNLVVAGAGILPQLAFLGVLAAGGYGIVRMVRPRRKDPPAPPSV